jgi:hypothetical protein
LIVCVQELSGKDADLLRQWLGVQALTMRELRAFLVLCAGTGFAREVYPVSSCAPFVTTSDSNCSGRISTEEKRGLYLACIFQQHCAFFHLSLLANGCASHHMLIGLSTRS